MTRILYFDASAGVSGDMFVGALLDLGANLEVIRAHVASLGVPGIELRARRVTSCGIAATKFDVLDPKTAIPVDEQEPEGEHGYPHPHAHPHPHTHGHGHEHLHAHVHSRGGSHHHPHPGGDGHHHPHRGLREIRAMLHASPLPVEVAADALGVFEALASAEAQVHGVEPETVHFHEVGALDAIADIVAGASAFAQVAPDVAICSPIHVGCGTVRCAHGVLPVPAPATLELLRGVPVYSDGTRGELATPTGVALLRRFCSEFRPMPPMLVEAVGYGAGSKDFGLPNVLRATLGSVSATSVSLKTAATA